MSVIYVHILRINDTQTKLCKYYLHVAKGVINVMELQIEQIISELSNIDNDSENIISSANAEKDNYSKGIEHDKKVFDDGLQKELESQLAKYSKKLETENNRIIQQMRSNADAELKKLEDIFMARHTEIAKSIFDKLTKE